MMKSLPVSVDPELMSGTPCFTGTRVPLHTLIDYLETGATIETFLEDFPSVQRVQIEQFLRLSERWMIQLAAEQGVHENLVG
jgi:uncharacterized protein (DUF433 family)